MPRKTSSAASKKKNEVTQGVYWLPSDAAWGGFVNIRLDDQQKEEFADWFERNGSDIPLMLDDILGAGMKVAFAYDRENESYVVTFTGALVSNSNERYCATSRAGTFDKCLGVACFKHGILAQGDYGNFKPRTGRMLDID